MGEQGSAGGAPPRDDRGADGPGTAGQEGGDGPDQRQQSGGARPGRGRRRPADRVGARRALGGDHADRRRPDGVRVRLLLHRVLRRGGLPGGVEPHRDARSARHRPAGAAHPAPGADAVGAPGHRRAGRGRARLPRPHQDRHRAGGGDRRAGAVRRRPRALRRARHGGRAADGQRDLDRHHPGPLRRRRSEVAVAHAALHRVPGLAVRCLSRPQRRSGRSALGDVQLPRLHFAGGAGPAGPVLGHHRSAQPRAAPGRGAQRGDGRPGRGGEDRPIAAGRVGSAQQGRRQASRLGGDHHRHLGRAGRAT